MFCSEPVASNLFQLPGWYDYGVEHYDALILLDLRACSAAGQKQTQAMWQAQHLNNLGSAMHACWGIVPADRHALLLLFQCRSGRNMTSSATSIYLAYQFLRSSFLQSYTVNWMTISGGENMFRVPFRAMEGLMNSGYFGKPIPHAVVTMF